MAIIGNDKIASLKAMHGPPRGIVDEDLQLYCMGGRFQDHGLGRGVRRARLRNGSQSGLQEECDSRCPAVHGALIIAAL